MLVSADARLIAHARKLSTQAREPAPHYEHTEIGFNYRLSNLLAALGRAQLEVLPERVAARRRINDRYRELLVDDAGDHVHAGGDVRDDRTAGSPASSSTRTRSAPTARRSGVALEAEDIEARPVWKPMHLQPVFADDPMFGGEVSARLFERGLCLPSGSPLTDADQDRVVAGLRRAGALTADRRYGRRRALRARHATSRRRRASAPSGRCGR